MYIYLGTFETSAFLAEGFVTSFHTSSLYEKFVFLSDEINVMHRLCADIFLLQLWLTLLNLAFTWASYLNVFVLIFGYWSNTIHVYESGQLDFPMDNRLSKGCAFTGVP